LAKSDDYGEGTVAEAAGESGLSVIPAEPTAVTQYWYFLLVSTSVSAYVVPLMGEEFSGVALCRELLLRKTL
jgi:hypothetical protein